MNELSILFKYIGLSPTTMQTTRQIKRKKAKIGNTNYALRYISTMIIGILPMFLFILYSNKSIYSKLYEALKFYPQFEEIGIMFYMMNITMFSIFYIVGFIGTGMYAFSRTDELELLLTMPIKRRILTIYNLIISLSSQLFTIAFFLGATFGFMLGWKNVSYTFLLKTLLQLCFITSISALFSILSGGINSKSIVRKINVIIVLLLVFIYFGFSYLQDIDVTKLAENENIIRWFAFTTSKYNVLTWAYSSDKLLISIIIAISIVASILFWYLADKVIYEEIRTKTKKKDEVKLSNNSSYASKFGPFFWKDLKALQRNEQFIFLIFYPVAFGLFMMFVSNSVISSSVPFLAIAVLYCAMESGLLTMDEFKYSEIVKILPSKKSSIIIPKLVIPVSMNFLLLILINLVALLTNRYSKEAFIFLPLALLLFLLSALIGAYYSITKPGRRKNQPFTTVTTFIIEGITLGLAFGMLFPIGYLSAGPKSKGWTIILSWTSLIVSIVLSIILAIVYYKKLKKTIINMND
ncbi:hypothetical protein [Fervidobacterium nodosum]|uniref:Uncharacterized protein n=1 Tax=Fervidobacterium nodosum (strain ATCC 35602 / DSM 5306 / Rt17-B1) TaxID=381764 RepID=A7HJN6_FERNB|nr:hypothetical protein [Fervidobacterium nodosum]ABS60119.1 hypothetical protein Fnod_0253 [Fervidobacterium nodosum Rt17-B1]